LWGGRKRKSRLWRLTSFSPGLWAKYFFGRFSGIFDVALDFRVFVVQRTDQT
jgi:hypothetical protein